MHVIRRRALPRIALAPQWIHDTGARAFSRAQDDDDDGDALAAFEGAMAGRGRSPRSLLLSINIDDIIAMAELLHYTPPRRR